MTFLYLLAGLLLLFSLISALPLKIRISYSRQGEEDLLVLGVHVWPGLRYSYRVDMMDFRANTRGTAFKFRQGNKRQGAESEKKISFYWPSLVRHVFFWIDVIDSLKPAFNYIRQRTMISDLKWKTIFGFKDPFTTGVTLGLIWSLKGYITSSAGSLIRFSGPPALSVVPDFNNVGISINLNCIFMTRTGYIISTGVRAAGSLFLSGKAIKVIKMLRKYDRRRSYGRTSNRGLNENSHGKH